MKKYLPIIIFALGILVAVGAYFFVIKGRGEGDGTNQEEANLIEVPFDQRPIASLTPTDDGHWLKLNIDRIVIDAASLDYELVYNVPDGVPQGVPGTVDLEGKDSFEIDLLLGSESSGKFRYDEGVEEGTLTLRFRDEKGRLLARFSTPFHLQTQTSKLTSLDGDFSYVLESASDDYFVTMQVFGLPDDFPGSLTGEPYGIFSSSEASMPGAVEMDSANIYHWDGNSWQSLDGSSPDIGIFATSS